jgi:hypothetical protein
VVLPAHRLRNGRLKKRHHKKKRKLTGKMLSRNSFHV